MYTDLLDYDQVLIVVQNNKLRKQELSFLSPQSLPLQFEPQTRCQQRNTYGNACGPISSWSL